MTVDASGDADLAAMAGLPCFVGDNGRVQNPTMIFRLFDVDTARFRAAYGDNTIMPSGVSQMIATANASGKYRLPRSKIWMFETPRPGELICNCTRVTGPDGRELNTLFMDDFTDAELEGRLQMREYARFFRDHLEGCQTSFVNDSGTQVGVRQTRQVGGVTRLMNSDVVGGTKFAGGIARSPWPIELHAGERPKVEWLLDDYYEVPFGCFVPERGKISCSPGAACRPSTRPWRRPASPLSALPTVMPSAMPPPSPSATASRRGMSMALRCVTFSTAMVPGWIEWTTALTNLLKQEQKTCQA